IRVAERINRHRRRRTTGEECDCAGTGVVEGIRSCLRVIAARRSEDGRSAYGEVDRQRARGNAGAREGVDHVDRTVLKHRGWRYCYRDLRVVVDDGTGR